MSDNTFMLPEELWTYVFQYLDTRDLFSLVCVCHQFHQLGSDLMRRSVRLRIKREKVFSLGLVSLVSQARFNKIGLDMSEKNYQFGQHLRPHNFCNSFSKYWLRKYLNKNQSIVKFNTAEDLKDLIFNLSSLRFKAKLGERSFDEVNALFRWLVSSASDLAVVDFEGANLKFVDPKLFGRAMAGMLVANLSNSWLQPCHLREMLGARTKTQVGLQFLNLACEDLSQVDPRVLANGLVRVKCADLRKTQLTSFQIEHLLHTIVTESPSVMNLCDLTLADNSQMSEVKPTLLGPALSLLAQVDLHSTFLTPTQLNMALSHLRDSSTVPSSVSLACVDLSQVEPVLLASFCDRLTSLDLVSTQLTDQQTEALSSLTNSGLEVLGVDCDILASLPFQVMTALLTDKLRRLAISGGDSTWSGDGGKATKNCLVSSLRNSTSLEDVSALCCGIGNTTAEEILKSKYPSFDSITVNSSRKYFLNA